MISAAAIEVAEPAAGQLREAGLLIAHGHEPVAVSPASDDDVPLPVIRLADGSLGVFDAEHGPVSIEPERLMMYRVNIPAFLGSMVEALKFVLRHPPHELVPGVIWDLGSPRFFRSSIHSLWFVRRSDRPEVQWTLKQAVESRPTERLRVIVTSSRSVEQGERPAGVIVVPLEELLLSPDRLSLSPEFLGGRLRGPPEGKAPDRLHLSADEGGLMLGSAIIIRLRSPDRRAAIRKLLSTSASGGWTRATEVTSDGSLRRFFGPGNWKKLQPLLEQSAEGWRFRL